jgi:NDP-sugar pyrophosphorylase family protein
MKAMVFAAGLGTRLRPLTNDRPKALVTAGGRTLLEMALARLRAFGVDEAIVNVHHCADQIESFLAAKGNFGMRIEVSREEVLLDTGGGLKKAAWFFLESDEPGDEPFIVHNVDVLSAIDLARMVEFHRRHNALATLAVQRRATSRPLLFDDKGQLRGRGGPSKSTPETSAPALQQLAFAGIHVVSPRIFAKLEEEGAFSIVDAYARLAAEGETILGFRADGAYWRDLGRPEQILEAEVDLASGRYPAD